MATCYQLLQNGVDKKGDIVYFGHRIPMRGFLRDIERFGGALSSLGLVKGDVVTLYLPSCPQSLVAFYACSKLGLVANIIHPLVPVNLLKDNIAKTQSKVLLFYDATVKDERPLAIFNQKLVRCSISDYVTARKLAYKAYSRCSGKRLSGIATYTGLLKLGSSVDTQHVGNGSDIVCYMHSGGTSGQPKIVKLSNDAFNNVRDGMFAMYHPDVQSGYYNLATLPVFHAYGLCAAMHGPLTVGYSLILVPQFKPKTVARLMRKYNVKVWSVVPAMLKKMLALGCFDHMGLKNLDVIWCGGDVCDEQLVEKIDAILAKYGSRAQLMRGYGLTEVCGVCIVNNYDHYRKGSCGHPMPGNCCEIWDDDANTMPVGQVGEIAVSGGGVMSGYLEGEDCIVQKNGKIWVKTGDVGYVDGDGYLYVVDRKKRSLKIAAVNVFPSQIENCVKKLSFIAEACAVGYKYNDKQYVKVFVTLSTPTQYETVKCEVVRICKENLIQYAVPYFVEVIDAMPRTDFGKIDYMSLENK